MVNKFAFSLTNIFNGSIPQLSIESTTRNQQFHENIKFRTEKSTST